MPISSVRYYERRGLLFPEARTGSGYRVYTTASLERLRFIRAAKSAGFTLANIAALFEAEAGIGDDPQNEVQALIRGRLSEVVEQIESLQQARVTLERWLETCQDASRCGRCAVIDGLAESVE